MAVADADERAGEGAVARYNNKNRARMAEQLSLFFKETTSTIDNKEEKVKALDELFAQSARYQNSAEFLALLEFINRFPGLSPYNAFLVNMQDSAASIVLSPHRWKKYGRQVKPYARPFIILVPFGPVEFVYDISDTEPINGEEDNIPQELTNPYETKGYLDPSIFHTTCHNADKEGITCGDYKMQRASAGYVMTQAQDRFLININTEYEINEKYSTLVHELAHVYCGHLGRNKKSWWESRKNLSNESKEFEAESVSFLVCKRHGLTTTSHQYLSDYVTKNATLPAISIETILTVSNHIEKMGLKGFKVKGGAGVKI